MYEIFIGCKAAVGGLAPEVVMSAVAWAACGQHDDSKDMGRGKGMRTVWIRGLMLRLSRMGQWGC